MGKRSWCRMPSKRRGGRILDPMGNPKRKDDEIDIAAEMGKKLPDAASQTVGGDNQDGLISPENAEVEVWNDDLF